VYSWVSQMLLALQTAFQTDDSHATHDKLGDDTEEVVLAASSW